MNHLENRVLGRVLAVEELHEVSGGWTLGSAGDTKKTEDTGTQTNDSGTLSDIVISPGSSGSGG